MATDVAAKQIALRRRRIHERVSRHDLVRRRTEAVTGAVASNSCSPTVSKVTLGLSAWVGMGVCRECPKPYSRYLTLSKSSIRVVSYLSNIGSSIIVPVKSSFVQ